MLDSRKSWNEILHSGKSQMSLGNVYFWLIMVGFSQRLNRQADRLYGVVCGGLKDYIYWLFGLGLDKFV